MTRSTVLLVASTLSACVTSPPAGQIPDREPLTPAAHMHAVASLAALPLAFEENRGQAPNNVKFLSRLSGATMLADENGPTLAFAAGITMRLAHASDHARVEGADLLPGRTADFHGSDPTNWRTGIPMYRRVWWRSAYHGIDLVFYGNRFQFEYDIVISPGADPSVIALRFDGATKHRVAPDGDLVLTAREREIQQKRPLAYQIVNGERQTVDSGYALNADGDVTFALGDYDRSRELIIDPVLVFSSYLVGGGGGNAQIKDVAVDLSGNMYVTGWAEMQNFPALGFGTKFGRDAFVIKLDASGSRIRYALYLGGDPTPTGGDDEGRAIAVDYNGNAFLAGITQSSGFPTTIGAYSRTFHGGNEGPSDIWVAKIDSGGQRLLYSTYLGGSDDEGRFAVDIAVDVSGSAYVAGETLSSDFPTTAGALDTTPKTATPPSSRSSTRAAPRSSTARC